MTVHTFPESAVAGRLLAEALGAATHPVEIIRYPDGECAVSACNAGAHAILYRPLHDPNAKLVELLLSAASMRRQGAQHVTLVAPYLPYLRQDTPSEPCQGLGQTALGPVLGSTFDSIVTVAPHVRRTGRLPTAIGGCRIVTINPMPQLGHLLRTDREEAGSSLIIGLDRSSETDVAMLAAEAHLPCAFVQPIYDKDRIDVSFPTDLNLRGKRIILYETVLSTGRTLAQAARKARALGASNIDALVCHALFATSGLGDMVAAGINKIRSADGIPHTTNAVPLAPLFADAVREIAARID